GKETAQFPIFLDFHDDVYDAVEAKVTNDLTEALTIVSKGEREDRLDAIKDGGKADLAEQFPDRSGEISASVRAITKKLVRERVLRDGTRMDGRALTDIRQLSAEVAVVPRVHGSALFERGETQILGIT